MREEIYAEAHITSFVLGKYARESISEQRIGGSPNEGFHAESTQQLFEENLNEDTGGGCSICFVQMYNGENVPTNSIRGKQVTEE